MDREQLQAYLHHEIPLSREMGVEVGAITPASVTLAAPLEPNINHKSTVFGGSISALGILSGWALVHLRLRLAGVDAELVIRANQVAYGAPARSRFAATAMPSGTEAWDGAIRQLRRGRMARFAVSAEIEADGAVCARFTGEYVAVPRRSAGGAQGA
ncbi:YiiD C-terminal domain-containing protein [Arenibaculum pallidiluteum]|uniref:YiiD C-terminal domain-containing protein n=1 Tax=Arenibaculum pallidiluteum TaxID=2812559 RepID=UPI001A97160D|nr:YiiD C-terminal domain-containing protein [Arenibaculum pallidiluteum]